MRTLQPSGNPVVTSALVALNVAIYVVSSIGAGLTEPSFRAGAERLGETIRREHAVVAQLMAKGEQFSATDRRQLFDLIGANVIRSINLLGIGMDSFTKRTLEGLEDVVGRTIAQPRAVSLLVTAFAMLWFLFCIPLLIFSHIYFLHHAKRKAIAFGNFHTIERVTGKKVPAAAAASAKSSAQSRISTS